MPAATVPPPQAQLAKVEQAAIEQVEATVAQSEAHRVSRPSSSTRRSGFLYAVAVGTAPVALSHMLAPAASLKRMLLPAAFARHAKDNPVVQASFRCNGFFYLCLSATMGWAGSQPLESSRSLLRAQALLWLLDALLVKFHIFRRSGVVRLSHWAAAGTLDLAIACACFHFSRQTPGREGADRASSAASSRRS